MGQEMSADGGNVDPATITQFCNNYLARQETLVGQLESICDAQRKAIETLNEDDPKDFDPDKERTAPTDHRDAAVSDELKGILAKSEGARKARVTELTDEERNADDVDFDEEEGRGFTSVKPFLGAMAPPSGYSKNKALDGKPNVTLELEHVYGYRSRLLRNNLAYVDENRVVYNAASVGIVYNKATNKQTFFRGHDDDIISLAYHEDSKTVATGQSGKDPIICIWSVDDPSKPLQVIKGVHKRGVCAISFSKDGARIASVGLDDNHSVAVHKVKCGSLEAKEKGDTNPILHVGYNMTKGADGNADFVTVGVKHVYFWTQNGKTLKKSRGLLGKAGERQPMLSVAFTPSHTLVSTKTGHVYAYKENNLDFMLPAHTGMCYTVAADICPSSGKSIVVTGSKDGTLAVWDGESLGTKAPKTIAKFDLNEFDETKTGKNSVRATYVDYGKKKKVVVGTACSSVYVIDLDTKDIQEVMEGHFGDLTDSADYGEAWGLTMHPTAKVAVSCGEDCTIRAWDLTKRKQVNRVDISAKPRCVNFHPSGNYLAVGDLDGGIAIIDTNEWSQVFHIKKAKRRVQCLAFSPDGTKLCAGTGDNNVMFFSFADGTLTHKTTTKGHSSTVNHLDWSKDSKWVQTDSQAYDLLYYDGETGKQNPHSKSLKDTEYAEQTCTLGWNVQGIWPPNADGTDVNTVRRSHSEKLLATVEDSGLVKVFNFPCIGSGMDSKGKLKRRPESVAGEGHSEHVTNVAWSPDDSTLITTGGADNCVMQWRVVSK